MPHSHPCTSGVVGSPPDAVETLSSCFIEHAEQVGFVLSKARFLEHTRSRSSTLTPALIYAACTWGARMSCDESLAVHEPISLSRAVQGVADCLAHVSQYNITHVIQAEVLLATYFYSMGRSMEGHYHTSAAVALAVILQSDNASAVSGSSRRPEYYQQSRTISNAENLGSSVDEEERQHIFWAVYILDRTWSVATDPRIGAPFVITHDVPRVAALQIDAPTQASISDYTSIQAHTHCALGAQCTMLALRARAADLYERTSSTTSQFSGVCLPRNTGGCLTSLLPSVFSFADTSVSRRTTAEFFALENTISTFLGSLPRLDATARPEDASSLMLVRALAYTAAIQLFRDCHDPRTSARRKALASAMSVSALLDDRDWEEDRFVDPILSILWGNIARVLIGQSASRRICHCLPHTLPLLAVSKRDPEHEDGRMALRALQKVQQVMALSSRTIPNMGAHLPLDQVY
ncbi:uncharacterized protein C8Q71DRAFT_296660 [Rhodofomes roseus]|uniref:Xylanolytic transcriptional activator regulatory domain-containing protein n=1 Tax=Rhodofomes roseus TaxID=34475 RepID=A0ABQ8K567_9APHY|nr:uncharacterized protein C8Q71DRAFT_296660 [Rhodofomes roseus]KAH9831642.1 hypothetical protein C8Q71DRAFT_296660 [Rhodofomes roseus]